ncbi:hypothetical protein HNQ59_002900 [Chitinivorax tropicus]|uniref:DUF2788 domain-containing protein n=1 Tax=Chitinivorax tropicus TaxID=714531 RepID=A0A840MLT3_9PROT|nr:DUF2788 domain-containing protein [Chitinivorax tropicus]MBB5019598.1 hypothetical protein [Chitinivorax tropicus]
MSEELFTELSLQICLTGLILYMGFIVYDLAKESKAGKYGTVVMFGTLGLGVLGFVIKTVITKVLS